MNIKDRILSKVFMKNTDATSFCVNRDRTIDVSYDESEDGWEDAGYTIYCISTLGLTSVEEFYLTHIMVDKGFDL